MVREKEKEVWGWGGGAPVTQWVKIRKLCGLVFIVDDIAALFCNVQKIHHNIAINNTFSR